LYLLKNPSLQTLINPIYHCDYGPGGPGNYGANLKLSRTEYRNFTPQGLEKLLEIKGMQIPLITTKEAFQDFIRDTPVSTRGIALMCDQFMSKDKFYPIIYAIAYEKDCDCDRLYIYDSEAISDLSIKDFKLFFRENFYLLYPNKRHRVYNQFSSEEMEAVENASAFEDVSILYKNRRINSPPPIMGVYIQKFNLSPAFDYHEPDVRRKHMCELIRQNEAGLLLDTHTTPSLSR